MKTAAMTAIIPFYACKSVSNGMKYTYYSRKIAENQPNDLSVLYPLIPYSCVMQAAHSPMLEVNML